MFTSSTTAGRDPGSVSLATVATIYLGRVGLIVWLCAVIVGWARIRTGNHTVLQVLTGQPAPDPDVCGVPEVEAAAAGLETRMLR